MSFFKQIEQLPEDPILSLPLAFGADNRPFKVNLGIGSYKTAEGHPFVLESVKKGEAELLKKQLNKEYLPIIGDEEFLNCSLKLLFGSDLKPLQNSYYFAAQTVGGSGALRIAGEFIAKNLAKTLFISNPSWPNHFLIFERSPLQIETYPYLNLTTHQFDFSGMCETIKKIAPKNVILLHGCCHNPTGIGPSSEQWKELSALIKAKNLLPFFDIAYQGFGIDIEQDAWPIRYFAQEGHEMIIAYSFAKNFGLYGERVGFLTIVSSEQNLMAKIASQVKTIVRGIYSTPPLHGERIVKTILQSPTLTQEWHKELQEMQKRVNAMRHALTQTLQVKSGEKDFSYIEQGQGLFCLLSITPEQVQRLRDEYAIYMPSNGRINLAGLNVQNLDYVAKSILSVLEKPEF